MNESDLQEWIWERIQEKAGGAVEAMEKQGRCGVSFIAGQEVAYRDVIDQLINPIQTIYGCSHCGAEFLKWQLVTLHIDKEKHPKHYCPNNDCRNDAFNIYTRSTKDD